MPGEPAPWFSLPPDERRVDLDRVRRAIAAAPPPGLIAWSNTVAVDEAGLLLPVYEEDGEARLVLTRRASHLRRNAGDVALPGGRRDPGETLRETALREAHEEIGLDPAVVEVLGELDHFITIVGSTEMAPFVGVVPTPLDLAPNPHEVDEVLLVPVSELLSDGVHRAEVWGEGRTMHQFDLVGDTVWGATARLLHRFLELVLAVPVR